MTALEESIFADLLGAVKMVENGANSEQVRNFVEIVCELWGRQTVAVFLWEHQKYYNDLIKML